MLYLYRLSFAKTIGPGRSAITMTPVVRRVDTPDPGYSSRLGAAAAWRGSYVAPRQCVPASPGWAGRAVMVMPARQSWPSASRRRYTGLEQQRNGQWR